MKRQHHFIVVYDEETNRYSIDWETAGVLEAVKGGTVYDTDKEQWHSSLGDDLDSLIGDRLHKILDEANSQV
jgi:ABC-type Fe3+-citrate transport system substrate-binding protein